MRSQLRPAFVSFVLLTILTGIAYPLVVTGFAVVLFPGRAHGSILIRHGKPIGSTLIAQPFTDPKYFWPRPSAANYNGAGGSGSNLGPSNPALTEVVAARVAALKAADPGNDAPVPVDLVTASGSGLDPHISVAAARYQMARVARARGIDQATVDALLGPYVERRTFSVLGEDRVNVLLLNLALDHPDLNADAQTPEPTGGGITIYRSRGFMPRSR